MSTRAVASLSIVGGSALAVASIVWGTFDAASPVADLERLLFVTGFVGLAIAIWGLVARFNDRMIGGAALLGGIGGLGSAIAGLGTAGAGDKLGAGFGLLPIGSTAGGLRSQPTRHDAPQPRDRARGRGVCGRHHPLCDLDRLVRWRPDLRQVSLCPALGAVRPDVDRHRRLLLRGRPELNKPLLKLE